MTERLIPPVFNAVSTSTLADVIDLRDRLVQFHASSPDEAVLMRDQGDALVEIARLSDMLKPAQMRRLAVLDIRCSDCVGRNVAWVAWVSGRPLFVGDQGDRRFMVSLLDAVGFASPTFRCRRRLHRFIGMDVPRAGSKRRVVTVDHGQTSTVMVTDQRSQR